MSREPTQCATRRPNMYVIAAVAVSLLLAGCVVEVPVPSQGTGGRWFELWMTDAAGDVSSLEVGVASVLVNQEKMHVDAARIDLLAHHGVEDGIKIASGFLEASAYDRVQVAFSDATATVNGTKMPVEMPDSVLTIEKSIGFALEEGRAMMVDVNVSKSLRAENGTLVFTPSLDAVLLAAAKPPARATGAPSFGGSNSQGTDSPTSGLLQPTITADIDPFDDVPLPTESAGSVPLSPQVGGALDDLLTPPPGAVGWFVQFEEGASLDEQLLAIESGGASPVVFFGSIEGAFVWANEQQAADLSQDPSVTYIEPDRPVQWLLATSKTAIRVPDISAPIIGLTDPSGHAIDGSGVGVAVIDIGIDGTHPDLPYATPIATDPLLLANYKVESMFQIDIPNTDTFSGHGTHVASILAGRGVLDPTERGVAPGVSLYGFGVGEASTTLWTNQALDWIVQNHDNVDPPIKIVSNSWQTSSSYDANSLTSRLVNQLVSEGVTVVFAAGNAGASTDGAAKTSGECQNPTEGVICVAAYDDLDTGVRTGKIASYSSRGAASKPASWPDISAPGSSIRAAAPLLGYVTGTNVARYTEMDGTSMAAPHVSGIVALMLQADGSLSPAQVEKILEDTAYKFTDGGSYATSADARYNGSHLAKGHGLADAYAAVQKALS